MAAGDDRRIELDVRGALDTIETGPATRSPQRWRRLGVAGLVAAALVVGALGGYFFAPSSPIPKAGVEPTAQPLVPGAGQPPTTTGNRCSVQVGNTLQLGLEIVNGSTVGVTLLGVKVSLPMDGLRVTGVGWGSCGQLGAITTGNPYPLPPGATTWLTMTFDVLTPCPAPFPVQVSLTYSRAGTDALAYLGGFSDLGDVPYTGCSTTGS